MLHKTIEERLQDWIHTGKAKYNDTVIEKIVMLVDPNFREGVQQIGLYFIKEEYEHEEYSKFNASINDIFFGPSNYWEVMFPEDGTTYATETLTRGNEGRISRNGYKNKTNEFHQIQCLIHTQNGGTIESYLDDNLE